MEIKSTGSPSDIEGLNRLRRIVHPEPPDRPVDGTVVRYYRHQYMITSIAVYSFETRRWTVVPSVGETTTMTESEMVATLRQHSDTARVATTWIAL